MIQSHCLETPDLERFLERQRAGFSLNPEIDLDLLLSQILLRAWEFVPSESGSILLDDPFRKVPNRADNDLVFIATFGRSSKELIGRRMSANAGIVGRVYQTGQPYLSENVETDEFFFSEIDEKIGHRTQSLVCVPIYIGKHVCGVLELINRVDGTPFTERDRDLLEIFAGYTSFTLQNALDAKRAHELAKKDDLTGLFNDRWFHVRLNEALTDAERTRRECVVIFMDLDNFKKINDQHGHLAGSQVLREIGFLLKRVVQQENATVARYGGDEFVMILPETPLVVAAELAERVRKSIEGHNFLEREYGFGMPALNLRGILSASIGVALYVPQGRQHPLDLEKNILLKRADSAMYQAKSEGRNRIVVSDPDIEDVSLLRGGSLSEG